MTIQIELKFELNIHFSIRRKEAINYTRMLRVSLYRQPHFYYYMVRQNMTCFTYSVTIRELCKPTYKIIRLEAAVINVIL
jgi:hypothetical protein